MSPEEVRTLLALAQKCGALAHDIRTGKAPAVERIERLADALEAEGFDQLADAFDACCEPEDYREAAQVSARVLRLHVNASREAVA